jgi:hypothetical protein
MLASSFVFQLAYRIKSKTNSSKEKAALSKATPQASPPSSEDSMGMGMGVFFP